MPKRKLRIKRVYEPPAPDEGMRILVDRVWPRGLTKEKAALDRWLKEIAPSTELRRWFGHDPTRWTEFQKRYAKELAGNPAVAELRALTTRGAVTILFGAHDEEHNNAVALVNYLGKH